jgi:hypothetical protein
MLRTAIWIGVLLRLGVAIWNGFFGPSFGADQDAAAFHLEALAYASSAELDEFRIGWFFSYALGTFYYLATDSLFLGSLLSCIAWLASLGMLMKIMRLLNFDRSQQGKAMLVYALLPSSVLFTAVTLREPYELLFVNVAIYSALNIYLNKSARHWLFLFFATFGMGVLHGALFAFGIFTIVATIVLVAMRARRLVALVNLIIAAPLVALIAYYGLSLFTGIAYSLDDGLGAAIQLYQERALSTDARANYKTDTEIVGVIGLLLSIPVFVIQYLFEPMPWRISAAADVVLLLENILRTWLIYKAWTALRSISTQARRPVLFVFLSYVVIETIWSLGTTNWGTAVRHHLPAMGLLLVAAFAYQNKKFVGQRTTGPVKTTANLA